MLTLIQVGMGQQSHLDGVNSGKSFEELYNEHHMMILTNSTNDGNRCSLLPGGEPIELSYCSIYSAFDKSQIEGGTFYYS